MASVKQGIKRAAKNRKAKYKMTYTYKQTLGTRTDNSLELKYTYSKSIEPTTSTLKY